MGGKCEHNHQENSCIKCLTCFYFLLNKLLTFLKNIIDEASSNEKDEFASMMAAVHKLSNAVIHYASNILCANVQFYAIEKIMQSMETDPSIVYMVPDHKHKVLRTRYREGQVD